MKTLTIFSLLVLNFSFSIPNSGDAQYTDNFAASFNGTNSYISVANHFDVSPSSAITVEAWIFPTTLPGTSACIIGKNYLTGYYFGIESTGRFIFFPKPGSFLRSRASGIVKQNQWAHIAATYDGVTTRLFLNGVQDTSTTTISGPMGVNTDSLFIGADRLSGAPAFFFNGRLDNVRIWRTPRTVSQIADNRYIPYNVYQLPGIYSLLTASFQFDNSPNDFSGTSFNNGNERNITYINYNNKTVNHVDFNNNLVFNGTTDYCSQSNITGNYFNPTTSLTLECWVKRDTTGPQNGVQHILNKSGGSSRYNYGLFIYSTGEVIFAINSGNYFLRTAQLLTNAQWTHIAATYSSSTGIAIIYLNGDTALASIISSNVPIQNDNDSLFIGKIGASSLTADKFKGQLDEVRIWRSVRTNKQVKEYMYKHVDNASVSDSLCYFDFDRIQTGYVIGQTQYISSMKIAGSTFITSAHNNNSTSLSSPMLSDPTGEFSSSFYTTSNKRFFIPDGNAVGTSDSIFISGDMLVNNLKAFVLMSHSYTSDIRITLTSPFGTSIDLLNRKGGNGNDIMTIFSDAADSIASLTSPPAVNGPGLNSPFSPEIKPDQALSAFNGQSVAGWWKLNCFDLAGADRGYVHGWGINLLSQKAFNLTSLIQGFYDPVSHKMKSDTAQIFLRAPLPPYLIRDSAKAILDSNGNAKFYFNNVSYGYRVFKHRNSIETWSAAPVPFGGDTSSYNFTTSSSQAFGNNMILIDSTPVKFAVYNGDVNHSGTIDLDDLLQIYNAASFFASGYVITDVTGDNITNLNDVLLAFNNSSRFVSVVRP